MIDRDIEISIVVPIYDEEENIVPLYERIAQTMDALGRTWEAVFVDDGSQDQSFNILKAIGEQDNHIRVIQFRRNFGQTAALEAGFNYSQGRIIVTMDGDLQNDPADIPRLVTRLEEGYDIVSGWRRERKDPFFSKRLPSVAANRLVCLLTGIALHDYGCTLKAYRREVINEIHLYGELHRFIPAVANSIGVRIAEIEVAHHPRVHGKSKYGASRMLRGFLDLITLRLLLSYQTRPMQLFGSLGLLLIGFGGAFGLATLLMKGLLGVDITGNPFLYLGIFGVLMGMQFISLGFLAELSVRTYHETQQKPTYVVRETLGGDPEPEPVLRF